MSVKTSMSKMEVEVVWDEQTERKKKKETSSACHDDDEYDGIDNDDKDEDDGDDDNQVPFRFMFGVIIIDRLRFHM